MVRSPASIRKGAAGSADDSSARGDGSSGSLRRKVLLGVGLAGVAYVVVRRLRSGSGSADDSGDWYQLSIDESVDDEAGDEATDDATADEELPGEARTDEEIAERAEENVREEPAEPGEMNVDEEVVDEIVDDEETGGE